MLINTNLKIPVYRLICTTERGGGGGGEIIKINKVYSY